jgi:hypothetical protein
VGASYCDAFKSSSPLISRLVITGLERVLGLVEQCASVAGEGVDHLKCGCRLWRLRLAFTRVCREVGPMAGAVRPDQAALSHQLDVLQAEVDALRGGLAP